MSGSSSSRPAMNAARGRRGPASKYRYGGQAKLVTILALEKLGMTRSRLLFATALLLISTSAFAQNWRGLLDSAADDLQAQRYARARHTTIKLINSMMDNLNTGNAAAYTLGLTVAYRAVAEAGLGITTRRIGTGMWHCRCRRRWRRLICRDSAAPARGSRSAKGPIFRRWRHLPHRRTTRPPSSQPATIRSASTSHTRNTPSARSSAR